MLFVLVFLLGRETLLEAKIFNNGTGLFVVGVKCVSEEHVTKIL